MQLKATIGLTSVVFYGVGVIVGAGVYSVIGVAAAVTQDNLWFSFIIGGLVAILTGLSYAEMTSSFPAAGGAYSYVRHAIPKAEWLAFIVAVVILIGGSATAATVAVAFGGYFAQLFDAPPMASALLLLVGCTVLNIIGLRESSWANTAFTCIEVGGLLVVIAAGLSKPEFAKPLTVPLQPGVLEGAAILFFVYLGFEEIANLSEEVHKPSHTLPRAIFASIGITTFLYVLVALSVLALVPAGQLADSSAPLAVAVKTVWPTVGPVISAIALFSTANTVLITMIATSRMLFAMGRDRVIHHAVAILTPKQKSPAVAAALTLGAAAILVPVGNVKALAEAASFAALLAFLAVHLSLIKLRYSAPHHSRPFRLPLAVGRMPVLPLTAIASIAVLLVHFELGIYLAGAAVIAISILIYAIQAAVFRRPKPVRK